MHLKSQEGCCGGHGHQPHEGCCSHHTAPPQESCSCGHAHGAADKPTMTGPLSLLGTGSAGRMLLAGVAITGLWALTFWAMRA